MGQRIYDFGSGPLSDAVAARQRTTLVGHELQDRYARNGWNFAVIDVVLSGVYRTDIPRQNPAPRDLARAHALLAELNLIELAKRRFLELSRGEQRRVLIARGMAFEPAILLLDEPGSGLDAASRSDLDATISAASRSTVVVCADHSAAYLPTCITNVCQLEGGRLSFLGPRSERHAAQAKVGSNRGTETDTPVNNEIAPVRHAQRNLGLRPGRL